MTMTSKRTEIWHSLLNAADNLNLHELISQKNRAAGIGKGIHKDIPVVGSLAYSILRNRNIRHHKIISIDGA